VTVGRAGKINTLLRLSGKRTVVFASGSALDKVRIETRRR
jgi:hypothetical protein